MAADDPLGDIRETLGRLDGKMDILLEDRPQLEARVRTLEKKWAFGTGLYTAISAIVAAVISFVSIHYKGQF